jgi:hypothetical protein
MRRIVTDEAGRVDRIESLVSPSPVAGCHASPTGDRGVLAGPTVEQLVLTARTMKLETAVGTLLVVLAAPGCMPSHVIGPLEHEREEREKLLDRARNVGESEQTIERVFPPLTPDEVEQSKKQIYSCRSSYLWKNGLTWTGSIMVAIAGGVTVGGAYATGNNDTDGKIAFGVSAGSLAALGSALVAIGGIVQTGFTDRGCWVR